MDYIGFFSGKACISCPGSRSIWVNSMPHKRHFLQRPTGGTNASLGSEVELLTVLAVKHFLVLKSKYFGGAQAMQRVGETW